ncbi:MAG: hypothetical protein OXF25_01170 [Cyanobacteria bacterium MAG CAR3_bin_5]|nr:hypothetical protein [Cyanobacteria bacterium MAG CAR3_bin_5]
MVEPTLDLFGGLFCSGKIGAIHGVTHLLHLDIGCAQGHFPMEMAALHLRRNHLGLEVPPSPGGAGRGISYVP